MDPFKMAAISAAGMTAQKARIEAATLNLANMHTSIAPGTEGYRPLKAVVRAAAMPFASVVLQGQDVGLVRAELMPQVGAATRSIYEPGHPHADDSGMVAYPAVDTTQEMMTVMTAMRAYEANLSVLQVSKSLAAKALEIGGQG